MIAKAQLKEEYNQLAEALKGHEGYDMQLYQLAQERKEKELAIDKQTKEQLVQNSLELHTAIKAQGKAFVDSVVEHVDKVVTHTSGMWKGVIDVGAQKEHLDKSKEQLKDYLEKLKGFGKGVVATYDKELSKHSEYSEEYQTLIAERNAFSQKHNKLMEEETKRVNTELEKIEKNSQAMRLKQFNQYVERYQAVNSKIKDATKLASDAFKQLSASYAEEMANIDQEISENETAKYEEVLEKKAELAEEKIKKENAITEEEKKKSEDRIETLENELKANGEIDTKYKARDEKLKNDKRKKQEEQKKWEKVQKKIDLGQQIVTAVGDVAAGTAKALSYGPIVGAVLAAVVGAAGAVQIGIMTKQLAKFEDGGLLRGRRHSQGGMRIEGSNIEVEGGEYVVNRQSTDKNIGLIRYINSQRRELSPADISSFFARTSQGFEPPFSRAFEAGGQLPAVDSPSTVDNEYLVDAIRSIRIEPRVAVTDINRVQGEVVSVDNWVGL